MPRYIDADNIPYEYDNNFRVVAPKHQIDHMTTEDVQPVVHAKWFLDGDSSSEEEKCYRCSNCKAVLEEDYKWHNHNYCYHCGAKMDKKEATYIKDIFMTR